MENQTTKHKGSGFTIFYQILIAMCMVAIVPIGGLWYISVYQSKQELTSIISGNLESRAESLGDSIEQWTRMNLRALQQNAETPAIRSMDERRQNPVLESLTDTYDWVYLAFTVEPDGQNVGRSDGKPPKYYGDRSYFRQVMEGAPIGKQVLMGKTSNKPAYILATPIKDEINRTQGVLAIAMTLEDLSNTITSTRIGDTGYAMLLDQDNRLIAHGDGAISSELQDFSSTPALTGTPGMNGVILIHNASGKSIVAYRKTLDQGWKLIVQQDFDEAYAAANQAQRAALILLGATLVAVALIALLLARRLSTPIQRLTAVADEISRGNLEAEIGETDRNDEIGALAKAIERMSVSLRMAFERLRKG